MATARSFLREDEEQFECPICTELFKNPVSLPCGHNFCDACIRRFWEDKDKCQCPLCKQEFNKSLKLCVNTLFRDIVDNYKQHHVLGDSEKSATPEDVLCDCCLHSRRRADKTCLVCLTSYCKTHLEPHLRVATLKTHKLIDPVPKLEERICTKHHRILEENNNSSQQKPVCALCAYGEIQGQSDTKCADTKAQQENQYKDKLYIKVKNPKMKKKTKGHHKAPKTEMTEDSDETVDSEKVHIWYNDNMYTFSPLPLDCGFSSGRVYYDVPIKVNSDWELGVVHEKMRGKTVFSTKAFSAWVIRYSNYICPAWCPINRITFPDRVFLCVDYEQGRMFFVHPFERNVLFCLINCRFKGKLFLFTHECSREPLGNNTQDTRHTSAKWRWDVVLPCIALFFYILFAMFKDASWSL